MDKIKRDEHVMALKLVAMNVGQLLYKDGIIDICEMKFTDARFELDRSGYEALVRRREIFREATGVASAIHLVLVSASGVARGSYALNLQAVIEGDQLFG